jgi:hypothetical protein
MILNKKIMPTLSVFFGLIVKMYFKDHLKPHIHVQYQAYNAVVEIETAELEEGSLPNRQLRFIQAWVEIHREDLMANWKLCSEGNEPFKIEPLK